MNRRAFLSSVGAAPALWSQQGPPREERIEQLTAPPKPALAINHLGFLPGAKKTVIFRNTGGVAPAEFTVRDIGSSPKPFQLTRPLHVVESDLGVCLAGEFDALDREGMYQVTAGNERSVPFFIRSDLWRRTLPKAVGYYKPQRCGVAIPNFHPACHLDDARRRDTGVHVDVTGGWHDAGDLRKWMSATMLNGIALLDLARTLGETWDAAGSRVKALLEEAEWGNRYFLKMQDADGRVWADTAGGLNGDNSDNHWTDNTTGTADDRYINPSKGGTVQAMFVLLESMAAGAFHEVNAPYARRCLDAALKCWSANKWGGGSLERSWWLLAALELLRATGRDEWRAAAGELAVSLAALQQTTYAAGQQIVRGYWRTSSSNEAPLVDAVNPALPPLALLEAASALKKHPDAAAWRDAVKGYIEDYVLPMTARSPYRIMPFGLFRGAAATETYRPLKGSLAYRFFMPVRKQFWWVGTTSHLECHALLLARSAETFAAPSYRDLAFRQLEWVMGANPFGACLMSGEGMRNPYPHSRYVGLIPGGILNGIGGNSADEPVLDMEYGLDWRTTEYWSPHNAYYIRAVAALEHSRG